MRKRRWKFLVRMHDEIEIEQHAPNAETIEALRHFKKCRIEGISSINDVREKLRNTENGYNIGALSLLIDVDTPAEIASHSLFMKMQRVDKEIQNLKDGLNSNDESQRARFVALLDFFCNVLDEPPIVVLLPVLEVIERVNAKPNRGGRPTNVNGEKAVPSRARLERSIEMDLHVLCHGNTPAEAARKVAESHPTKADRQSQLKTLEKDYRWKRKWRGD
jgi:hypothetical protein